MKAAIITAPGTTPIYGDFRAPAAGPGEEVITVHASALSHFSKARSSGSHYSSEGGFPCVAGAEGVGVTSDGRRVYFVLPEAPFGSMAEQSLVRADLCVSIPDQLDDILAAAIANPGMSAVAALAERAKIQAGKTVLVHGATGTAGRLAVQMARILGAGRVLASARNAEELNELKALGADAIIPFEMEDGASPGAETFERRLRGEFAEGIDIVLDYLWGPSATTIMVAIAKSVDNARPVRFVHVGGASGVENIELPGAALRSSSMILMGSGVKSVSKSTLIHAIGRVFDAAVLHHIEVAIAQAPLSEIEHIWKTAPGKPRTVVTMGKSPSNSAAG